MARIKMFGDGVIAVGAVIGLFSLGSAVSYVAASGIVAVGMMVGALP